MENQSRRKLSASTVYESAGKYPVARVKRDMLPKRERERETVDRGGGFDVILLVLQMLRRSDTPETGSGENSNSAAQVLAVGDAV